MKKAPAHMSDTDSQSSFIELAADIVSAYVSNNSVPSADLASLISDVHLALVKVGGSASDASPAPATVSRSTRRSFGELV